MKPKPLMQNRPIPDRVPRHDPAHMLAWTEARCLEGVAGGSFALWEPLHPAVVLGLSQEAERELCLDALEADGIPVLRRPSGGGAVLLVPGVLCFEVHLPVERGDPCPDIHRAFRSATDPVLDACGRLGVYAERAGISDLAARVGSGLARSSPDSNGHADGDPSGGGDLLYKICGTAQLRKRGTVLVHGSMLVQAETKGFSRYLQYPSEVPAYRAGREHASFCRTIEEIRGGSVSVGEVAEAVRRAMTEGGVEETRIPKSLSGMALQLLEGKYRLSSWNVHRQRPKGL